jgi:hypothetical protein
VSALEFPLGSDIKNRGSGTDELLKVGAWTEAQELFNGVDHLVLSVLADELVDTDPRSAVGAFNPVGLKIPRRLFASGSGSTAEY